MMHACILYSAIALSHIFTADAGQTSATSDTGRYYQLADSADRCIAREEWKLAEHAILSALRLRPADPGNAMLLSNLGIVKTRTGDIEGALQAFDIALTRAPRSKTLYANRAATLLQARRDEEAATDLDMALQLDSIMEWPLKARGLMLLQEGDFKRSFDLIKRHARHYPADADLLAAGASCLTALGRHAEAVEWYDKAIATRPDPRKWFDRTLLKIQLERYGEAEDDVRRAIAIYPDAGNLYILRAVLKRKLHLNAEADEDKKIALHKGADPQLIELILDEEAQRNTGKNKTRIPRE